MNSGPKIYVFVGPSIRAETIRARLDCICLPPAATGDVYRAALNNPAAIALIDGYFESIPSVWHKEILEALSRGIRVYGSSSMGALRAAELHQFGMIGVGRVYEEYAAGTIEDD